MGESIKPLGIGDIKLVGGNMNLTTPIMLDDGKKVAMACGNLIIVHDPKTSRRIAQLELHKYKVVSQVHLGEYILSCDEQGFLCKWKMEPGGSNKVVHTMVGQMPLDKGSLVDHIAYCWESTVALVVNEAAGSRMLKMLKYATKINRPRMNNTAEVKNRKSSIVVLAADVLQGSNIYSFSTELSYCAVLTVDGKAKYALNIVPIFSSIDESSKVKINDYHRKQTHRKNKRVLMGGRTPVCVAVHPTHATIAVGDAFGGVQVYYNTNYDTKQVSRRLHWHHTPVLCLVFSDTGKELYSGGHEGVLVCWNMAGASEQEKSFAPGLGQPLTHVAVAGARVLASHSDNTFSVIDVNTMSRTNLLLGQIGNGASESLLLYDDRTQSLLTSARAGHLHFYNPWRLEQLFHLDISHENFIPEATAMRTIIHVALSEDGKILTTVDEFAGAKNPQTFLKFWAFSDQSQSWVLECTVLEPHSEVSILGLALHPDGNYCVTRTKWEAVLWQRVETKDKCISWQSFRVRDKYTKYTLLPYENPHIVDVCWNSPGSLLSIADESLITFYLLEEGEWEDMGSVNTYKTVKCMVFAEETEVCVVYTDGSLALRTFPGSQEVPPCTPGGATAVHRLSSGLLAVTHDSGKVLLVNHELLPLGCIDFPAPPLSLVSSPHPSADEVETVFANVPGKGLMSVHVGSLDQIPDEDFNNNINNTDDEVPERWKEAIVEESDDIEYNFCNGIMNGGDANMKCQIKKPLLSVLAADDMRFMDSIMLGKFETFINS